MTKKMTDHYKIKNNYWGFIKNKPIYSEIKREDIKFSNEDKTEEMIYTAMDGNR